MFSSKILIVDDEKDISKLIAMSLKANGFGEILQLYSGSLVIETILKEKPDLILLDLMLPEIDGLSLCRLIKENPKISSIPIIMISAKNEENDIVLGLELGANDYITKPFSTKVLIARVRNQLRLKKNKIEDLKEEENILKYEDMILDKIKRELILEGSKVSLTYSEFEILALFLNNPQRVFTRNQLLLNIKGEDGYNVGVRSIDVQILNLRRKLGKYGELIESVRAVGYRFNEKTC